MCFAFCSFPPSPQESYILLLVYADSVSTKLFSQGYNQDQPFLILKDFQNSHILSPIITLSFSPSQLLLRISFYFITSFLLLNLLLSVCSLRLSVTFILLSPVKFFQYLPNSWVAFIFNYFIFLIFSCFGFHVIVLS